MVLALQVANACSGLECSVLCSTWVRPLGALAILAKNVEQYSLSRRSLRLGAWNQHAGHLHPEGSES